MATVSTAPDGSVYTDKQWKAACLLKADGDTVKGRYRLPVATPDGQLHTGLLATAALALKDPLPGVTAARIDKAERRLLDAYDRAGLPVAIDLRKARIEGEARNDLPDSAFAYIEPDATKDAQGKSTPRSKRHFIIVDASHVRNALARIGQGAKFSQEALPKVRAAAKKFGVKIAKAQEPVELVRVVPLYKDDARQIVYGVVMSPDVYDSQGDILDAASIEKTAHNFLASRAHQHDVQHSELPAGIETVESFIAPHDLTIAGEKVLKGAWVMATHISDADTWERVRKGELTGYSIGGTGVRAPEAA